jgi:hypothetical protein
MVKSHLVGYYPQLRQTRLVIDVPGYSTVTSHLSGVVGSQRGVVTLGQDDDPIARSLFCLVARPAGAEPIAEVSATSAENGCCTQVSMFVPGRTAPIVLVADAPRATVMAAGRRAVIRTRDPRLTGLAANDAEAGAPIEFFARSPTIASTMSRRAI